MMGVMDGNKMDRADGVSMMDGLAVAHHADITLDYGIFVYLDLEQLKQNSIKSNDDCCLLEMFHKMISKSKNGDQTNCASPIHRMPHTHHHITFHIHPLVLLYASFNRTSIYIYL